MNYAETIDFLFNSLPVWERAGAGAYKPGLERIAAFVSMLGLDGIYSAPSDIGTAIPVRESLSVENAAPSSAPHPVGMRPVKTIHVAGTNGKGSTSHLLAAVLQSAGYRTGLFTSPHLVDFRERIRVDGKTIPEEAVVEFTERWKDEMVRIGLTFFEMATAMAFWWFAREGCRVAVIETGLGGRLDSTNIVIPAVSVITNIGLEHTQYLGDTIAQIAAEKAGIIKPGVPVVIGESDPETAPVFRARAEETESEIIFADKKPTTPSAFGCHPSFRKEGKATHNFSALAFLLLPEGGVPSQSEGEVVGLPIDLAGDYQQKNVRTVLATIDILRRSFDIPDAAVREGLQNAAALTGLRGRWEIPGTRPLTVCDTAHNAHGFAEVVRQIARQKYDKLYMVLGFAGDKDLDAIIPLLPQEAHYIFTQADTSRAMRAEEIAGRFSRFWTNHPVSRTGCHPSEGGELPTRIETSYPVPAAVRRALALAGPDDMIYIGGSNFVVGEALSCLDC